MRTATLALLLALAAFPLAAEITPPVNLGASGMTLSLRLWKWTEAGGWAAQSVVGLTAADLPTGEYTVYDLPTATDAARSALFVAESASPAVGLAAYHYGASPGQRIVWRHLVDLGEIPLIFKQHDTHGAINLDITSGLVEDIGDPSTTVAFALWNPTSGAVVFSGRAGTISNVALDASSGTYTATFSYDLQATDLDNAGVFFGEFTVTFPDATKLTLPANNTLRITVTEDFDGS